MPRIRTIKPDFWMNEDVAEWSRDTRLVFLGLLTYCQDHGVGSANVRRLASQILPMDDPAEASEIIRRALDESSHTGQVVLYEHDGRPLYWVTKFKEHQRVDRPGKCDLPLPTPHQVASSARREVTPAPVLTSEDEPRLTLVEDSTNDRRTLVPVVERSGREGEETTSSSLVTSDKPARPDVEALCRRLHEKLVETDYKPLPKITDQWRQQARLLLDKDERKHEQALRLITWALDDQFWSTNIASMGKFRQQYPKLLAAARREHTAQAPRMPAPSPRAQRLDATAALIKKLDQQEAERQAGVITRSAIQA